MGGRQIVQTTRSLQRSEVATTSPSTLMLWPIRRCGPRGSYQEIRNAEVGQSIMTTSSCGTVWVDSSCGNRHPGPVSTWRRSHPDGEWEATSGHPRGSGRLSYGCPQGWADQSRPIPGKSPGGGAAARLSRLRGQDAANPTGADRCMAWRPRAVRAGRGYAGGTHLTASMPCPLGGEHGAQQQSWP